VHLKLPDREIRFFSVLRRIEDAPVYHFGDMEQLIRISDDYGYSGVLLFQSNKAFIEPWFFSQVLLHQSKQLSPFIALNPVYMHPFTAARLLYSISLFHRRKVYVNFITGTSRSELEALGDHFDHSDRYKRLYEFLYIFNALIREEAPVTFSGQFYSVKNLQLSGKFQNDLWPSYFLAGSSPEAGSLIRKFDITHLQMAQNPGVWAGVLKEPSRKAIHFGIITAPTSEAAETALRTIFGNKVGDSEARLLETAMNNTDAVWKKMLYEGKLEEDTNSVYRLSPFSMSKSDCPYLVGSYDQVAACIEAYICEGITDIVVEINETNESFQDAANMLKILEQRMQKYYKVPEYISGTSF
jgi:alkanesulfonate monooxygenase